MTRTTIALLLTAVLALAALAGVAVATTGSGDVDDSPDQAGEVEDADDPAEDDAEGPDVPITGDDLERASRAALDHVGEGRVTGTEVDDEESWYEVEVTREDGSQVDVQLDRSFRVVGED